MTSCDHLVYMLLGGKHSITRKHLDKLRNGCIVGNMGHSVQEIDLVSIVVLDCAILPSRCSTASHYTVQ